MSQGRTDKARTEKPIMAPSLVLADPPFAHAHAGRVPITVPFLVAAACVLGAGSVLFGLAALRTLTISLGTALLAEWVLHRLWQGRRSWTEGRALVGGALFACTLPPDVAAYVVIVGSAATILVGEALLGGIGNYLWHPVALSRVLVQVMFHDALSPERWPILAPDRLVFGRVAASAVLPAGASVLDAERPADIDAWLVERPVDVLKGTLAGNDLNEAIAGLIRDRLPAWTEVLIGMGAGAIGEACVVATLLACLALMWPGLLRRRLLIAGVLSAAVMAAVLPVHIDTGNERITGWLPGVASWQGLPVGLAYTCYQLTAGGFLLVLLVLAPDPSSSPLTRAGHIYYGLLIGGLTMVFRITLDLQAAAYWALLVANTCVPILDRLTKRRVFGL